MGTSSSALQGTIIAARYRVVRELGAGGMGTVVEVEHVDLGRPFALKLLRLGQRGEEIEQRFRREARALAMVRSVRVAQVTDFGVDGRLGPWYVMELVDGESLEDRIVRDGALPAAEVVRLGAALCEAVADVHDASLVHRDLKPSNIGLPRTGPVPVKLIDFGLAASIDDAFLTRITQSQQVLGSLPYIAPEQFSGARPSPAADLWSIGVVLHEMLTGRLPFEAPSTAALMHAILTAPPPRISGLPAELDAILRRLLDKEPGGRPAGARLVAERLNEIATSQPVLGAVPRTVATDAVATSAALGAPSSSVGGVEIARELHPTRASDLDAAALSASTSPFTTTPNPAQSALPTGAPATPALGPPAALDAASRTSSTTAVTIPVQPRWALWISVALVAAALAGFGIKWLLDSLAAPAAAVAPLATPPAGVGEPATPNGARDDSRVGAADDSPVDERSDSLGGEREGVRDARADTARADTARADTARADTARADTARADTARADTARADTARADTARADTARAVTAGAMHSGQAPGPAAMVGVNRSTMSTARPSVERSPPPSTEEVPPAPRMEEVRPQGWRGGIIEDPE